MIRTNIHGVRPRPLSVGQTRDIISEFIEIKVGRNKLVGDRDLIFASGQRTRNHDRLIGPGACWDGGTGGPLTSESTVDVNIGLLITDRRVVTARKANTGVCRIDGNGEFAAAIRPESSTVVRDIGSMLHLWKLEP
jgi:hypothetical protein